MPSLTTVSLDKDRAFKEKKTVHTKSSPSSPPSSLDITPALQQYLSSPLSSTHMFKQTAKSSVSYSFPSSSSGSLSSLSRSPPYQSSPHLQKSVRFEKHIVPPLLAAVAELQIGHHSKVVQLLLNLPRHSYQKANHIVQSSVRRLYDEHNSKRIGPSFCCIRYKRESPSGKRNLLMSHIHGNHLSTVSCVTRSYFVRIYGEGRAKQRTFRWGRPSCSIDDNAIKLPDMYLDSSEMKGQSIYDEHPFRMITR